jgi:hypothetical protein
MLHSDSQCISHWSTCDPPNITSKADIYIFISITKVKLAVMRMWCSSLIYKADEIHDHSSPLSETNKMAMVMTNILITSLANNDDHSESV